MSRFIDRFSDFLPAFPKKAMTETEIEDFLESVIRGQREAATKYRMAMLRILRDSGRYRQALPDDEVILRVNSLINGK
jgi:hypothetical protein